MNTQHSFTKGKNRHIEKFTIFPLTWLQEESKIAEHNQAHGTFLQTSYLVYQSPKIPTTINMRHTFFTSPLPKQCNLLTLLLTHLILLAVPYLFKPPRFTIMKFGPPNNSHYSSELFLLLLLQHTTLPARQFLSRWHFIKKKKKGPHGTQKKL